MLETGIKGKQELQVTENNTANKVVISIVIGNSFLTVLFLTVREWNIALHPNISKIFKMLEPITFPKTISPLPEINDLTLTANSGADVPKATIVNPINILDTLKLAATLLAPSTKISAPLIKIINPTTSKITLSNINPPYSWKNK